MRRLPWLPVVLALSAGACSTSGVGSGLLAVPNGTTAAAAAHGNRSVRFNWRASNDATRGTMQAVLPDGRTFEGTFIQANTATQSTDVGPYIGGAGWVSYGAGYGGPYFARRYSGRVVGVLRGPGNEQMMCEFDLAVPERGPSGGGIGSCELSTGERIDYADLRGGQ
jgi:hypothetical protein